MNASTLIVTGSIKDVVEHIQCEPEGFPSCLTIAVKTQTTFGKNTEFGLNVTVMEFPGAHPPSLSASSEVRPPPLAPPRAAGALFLRVGVVL